MGDAASALEARKQASNCNNCHQYIDPIGRNYLAYSGTGALSGSVLSTQSEISATLDLDDVYPDMHSLSEAMGQSDHLKRCLALQVYRFALSRPEQSGEECHIHHIYNTMKQTNSRLVDGIIAALMYRGNAKRR
jgi:hypothetical protein